MLIFVKLGTHRSGAQGQCRPAVSEPAGFRGLLIGNGLILERQVRSFCYEKSHFKTEMA